MNLSFILREAPPRIVGFMWGFIFIQTFRYILDKTYPFFSLSISLSSFATILGALIFLSFWRYLPRSRNISRQRSRYLALAAIINAAVFLGLLYQFSEPTYLHLSPLTFSLQLIIQLYLLSSLLPFFATYRLSLLSGVLPGLLPMVFFQSPWFIFIASVVMAIFPAGLLNVRNIEAIPGEKRMLPLRQSLDFLRFLLFAFALYGTFDIFRSRFYVVATILTLAGILQLLILRFHERKEHIKFGLLSLGIALPAIALFYVFMPMNFASAIGYTILSAWEAVFFRRASEGYLRRERWLILGIIILSLLAYHITFDWVTILLGVLAVVAQLRFLPFLFKRYRKLIGFLFVVSILIWSGGIYNKYSRSITREFLTASAANRNFTVASIKPYQRALRRQKVYTNLLPPEVIREFSQKTQLDSLKYENLPPFLLPIWLWLEDDHSTFRLYHPDSQPPYRSEQGTKNINRLLQENNEFQLYSPKPLKWNTQLTEAELNTLLTLGEILANWLYENNQAVKSLIVYRELFELGVTTPELYQKAARSAATAGEIQQQIDFLKKYLSSLGYPQSDSKTKFRLMELYFYAGDPEKSEEMAEQLLREDPGNSFLYYRWLFRVKKGRVDKYQWQAFQRRVMMASTDNDPVKTEKKDRLLADIAEVIRSNPAWHEIYQQELQRQEHLIFPDF